MKMEQRLKPCPFCGNPDVVFGNSSEFNLYGNVYVYCTNGNCRASGGNFETKEEATEAWNRRIENK